MSILVSILAVVFALIVVFHQRPLFNATWIVCLVVSLTCSIASILMACRKGKH